MRGLNASTACGLNMVMAYHIAELMAVNLGLDWRIIACGGDVKHHFALIQLRQEPLIFIH